MINEPSPAALNAPPQRLVDDAAVRSKDFKRRLEAWRFDDQKVAEAEAVIGPFPTDDVNVSLPWAAQPAPIPRVCAAMVEAMRELMRPVFVRDVDINLFGRVAGNEPDMPPADRSWFAGLGVPLAAVAAIRKDK